MASEETATGNSRIGRPNFSTVSVSSRGKPWALVARAAGLGVAFRAKPIVAAAAAARIEHGDLTALLYLQGYARHEFACVRAD